MSTDLLEVPTMKLQTIPVEELLTRRKLIKDVMDKVMEEDVHYGKIPGTPKPTLYKAGAEVLCTTFMLAPKYETLERERDAGHLAITSLCNLIHIPTGTFVGSGRGSCSTRESKYAYRKAGRVCPSCNGEFIIKGKEDYGGGWLCYAKKGGCGAKFRDGDEAIESQPQGRVANEDVADQENTVLKMSDKRSLTAAVLNALACSDVFSQDVEDQPHGDDDRPRQQPQRQPQGGQRQQGQQQRPAQQQQSGQGRPAGPFAGGGQTTAGNGAAKATETKATATATDPNDPRPAYAKEILEIRDRTWDTPPSAQNWAKITIYHLGRPTPDTIYGDALLGDMKQGPDPEKLGGLVKFMRALKAEDESAFADLDDIIHGRDPKARTQA